MRYTNNVQEQKECTTKTMAWLHECWIQMEAGRPVMFKPDYPRRELMTPAIVHNVLEELRLLMEDEFKRYPGYHYDAQGIPQNGGVILIPTGFEKLPYSEQLAVVCGIDEVMQEYRLEDIVAEAGVDGQPPRDQTVFEPEYFGC